MEGSLPMGRPQATVEKLSKTPGPRQNGAPNLSNATGGRRRCLIPAAAAAKGGASVSRRARLEEESQCQTLSPQGSHGHVPSFVVSAVPPGTCEVRDLILHHEIFSLTGEETLTRMTNFSKRSDGEIQDSTRKKTKVQL